MEVLSLGLLCDQSGFDYHWIHGKIPYLKKGNLKVLTYPEHNVPLICAGSAVDSIDEDSSTSNKDAPKETSSDFQKDKKVPPPPKAEGDLKRPRKRRSRG